MILIEHATVLTLDAERRILSDGSVLVDGRDIVQVGPAASVRTPRPPDRVIDGRRYVVAPGFVDTHVHLTEHLSRGLMLDDIPVPRYLPDWLLPLYSTVHAGGGAGGRAAGLRRDDPHRHHDLLRGGHALRRGRGGRRRRAGGDARDPRPLDVGPRGPARAHEADDRRGAGAHRGRARQGERSRRRAHRRLAAAARLRHLLGGADPGRARARRPARRRLGDDAERAAPLAAEPRHDPARRGSTPSACSTPGPSSPTWSTSTTPASRCWRGAA